MIGQRCCAPRSDRGLGNSVSQGRFDAPGQRPFFQLGGGAGGLFSCGASQYVGARTLSFTPCLASAPRGQDQRTPNAVVIDAGQKGVPFAYGWHPVALRMMQRSKSACDAPQLIEASLDHDSLRPEDGRQSALEQSVRDLANTENAWPSTALPGRSA